MTTGGEQRLAEVPGLPAQSVSRAKADVTAPTDALQAIAAKTDLESVYQHDLSRLVGLAEWIVGSRAVAEEIVHDTFVKLVAKPPKLRNDQALSGYVRSAVVNGCNSKIRRFVLERKHRALPAGSYEDPERPDDDIRTAISQLPLRQRQVVVLRFFEDMTVDQIASELRISSGSVKTHLHRALAKLSTLLDERTLS